MKCPFVYQIDFRSCPYDEVPKIRTFLFLCVSPMAAHDRHYPPAFIEPVVHVENVTYILVIAKRRIGYDTVVAAARIIQKILTDTPASVDSR